MALSSPDKRIRGRKGQELRKRRLERTKRLCEDCYPSRITSARVVDHVRPLALGGEDTDDNTRNLCHECHAKRTAEQFGHKAPKRRISVDGWPDDE